MGEPDLAQLHLDLVTGLRQRQLLFDAGVEAAFSAVSRHLFLPQADACSAFLDQAVTLKTGARGETLSSASQPTMMAVMLQQLDLGADMNVLEIGAASGYNAALIRHIVGDGGQVTSLEIDQDLAQQARDNLRAAGFADVLVVNCDAAAGYQALAPYDRIIATACVWDLPATWLRQLRSDGKLVAPIWLDGVQVCAAFEPQENGSWLSSDNRPCAFVPLQGSAAGPQLRNEIAGCSLELLTDDLETIDLQALERLFDSKREIRDLGAKLKPEDFWRGFQLHLMFNAAPDYSFAAYSIPIGDSAYGMGGSGILLFSPMSAAFAPYDGGGTVLRFGDDAAYFRMQALYESWRDMRRSVLERLRLLLIPKRLGSPDICHGVLYSRKDHFLHAWLD